MATSHTHLTFDPNDSNDRLRFDLLYQGFISGGNESRDTGLAVLGTRVGVLTKLRQISEDVGQGLRRLAALPENSPLVLHGVDLEPDEITLLLRYLELTPWRVELSEVALATVTWLKAQGA